MCRKSVTAPAVAAEVATPTAVVLADDQAIASAAWNDAAHRRARELADACSRSPELVQLHRLIRRAQLLSEQMRKFINEHEEECDCDLCLYLDDDDISGVGGTWRDDVVTMMNVTRMCSSMIESGLVDTRRLDREAGFARQGGEVVELAVI